MNTRPNVIVMTRPRFRRAVERARTAIPRVTGAAAELLPDATDITGATRCDPLATAAEDAGCQAPAISA